MQIGFMRVPGLNAPIEFQRNLQPAIALKLSTLALAEKRIGFQEFDYQQNYRLLEGAVVQEANRLRVAGQSPDAVFGGQAYAELARFFEDHVYWREGQYSLSASMFDARLSQPHVERFVIELRRVDIDAIRANLALLETHMRVVCGMDASVSQAPFNWISLAIRRA